MAKGMSYQAYLASPEWKHLRAQARQRAGHQCEHCGGSPDHVHHVRYPKNLKDDVLENLIVVCESCHMKHHGIRGEEMENAIVLHFESSILTASVKDGIPLFNFREAFEALEYGCAERAYNSLGRKRIPDQIYKSAWSRIPEQHRKILSEKINGVPELVYYITEKGLYRLAQDSDSEKAERFKEWLADVALSIRQYGCYPPPSADRDARNGQMTPTKILAELANNLAQFEVVVEDHEKRLSYLDGQIREKSSLLSDMNNRINRTVAAPGQFTIRSYLLMLDINPEQKMTGVPIKQLIGKRCAEIGRARGIKPGKMVEGTFDVNTWPANIIEDALDEIGIVYVKHH